ncbi:Rab8D, rab family GTPase [Tribonema minus]|uniref:Rab8D, rab family GTPase n=1 Tax=Tribonema minus TaxID=303371 RepID=A0A835YM14_9STRA|nr:Rab8D, rab family GTPase [Tribonema minus]
MATPAAAASPAAPAAPAPPAALLIRVLMIGESSVGKTSLVLRYDKRGFNAKFTTTIGVDYSDRMLTVDARAVKLQIWDTAGQERFHSLTTSFFKRAEGFALVFDVSDRRSFDAVARWMGDIREQGKADSDVVLVGNKCDVKERAVAKGEAEKLAKHFAVPYFEASAKDNVNVDVIFETLASSVKRRLDAKAADEAKKASETVTLGTAAEPKKKSACC